ncbi:hypothetical protein DERF_003020 [Dermatophagoides farinae]|uniref:Uncharacterized protein n=1 Tax=Dermatophagoides farinae TaxID=6954 RepID=A0A922IES7_DERFA|nr:hypothetical protein DERF_003020 [Dermatophagoides farinae]
MKNMQMEISYNLLYEIYLQITTMAKIDNTFLPYIFHNNLFSSSCSFVCHSVLEFFRVQCIQCTNGNNLKNNEH